jgi:hypothetical protein
LPPAGYENGSPMTAGPKPHDDQIERLSYC